MTKPVGILLLLTVAAIGATDEKITSIAKRSPSPVTAFTGWKPLFLTRNGVVNTFKRPDFNDSLFEYRWKSERTVSSSVCTVELRHAEDAEDSHTIPEVNVFYLGRGPVHRYTARNLALGGKDGHVLLRQEDCERIDMVAWDKASEP
jgi:hypothetical protein